MEAQDIECAIESSSATPTPPPFPLVAANTLSEGTTGALILAFPPAFAPIPASRRLCLKQVSMHPVVCCQSDANEPTPVGSLSYG